MPISRVMAFLAHPDDTDTYCANFLKTLAGAGGKKISLHCITRGEHGLAANRDPRKEEFRGSRLGRIRSEELKKAAEYLGIPRDNVYFLDIEDSQVREAPRTAYRKVIRSIKENRPDLVLAPEFYHAYYLHPDHVYVGMIVFIALRKLGYPVKIFLYHSINNNYYHPVTTTDVVKTAVGFHSSQADLFRFLLPLYVNVEQVIHGMHLRGVNRAEAYRITSTDEPQTLGLKSRCVARIYSAFSGKS